jgi:hypothetical protein
MPTVAAPCKYLGPDAGEIPSDEHEVGRDVLNGSLQKVFGFSSADDDNLLQEIHSLERIWSINLPGWSNPKVGQHFLRTPYGVLAVQRLHGSLERGRDWGTGLSTYPPGSLSGDTLNFFLSKSLPDCFHPQCVRKQRILATQFHESIQRDNGAPEGIRTPDPQIRSLVLYPAELPAPSQEKGGAPVRTKLRTPM